MKKLLLSIVALLIVFSTFSNAKDSQGIEVKASKSSKAEAPINTGCTWAVGDKEYPIYILPKSGKCFIVRVKKTGKKYRLYLPQDVSDVFVIVYTK